MNVEEQTNENTKNIGTLANTVTELTTMFKYAEKARDEERLDVKAAVNELKNLNDKITTMASMQKEVTALASDVRALSHDFKNMQNGMQALALLKDKQIDCEKTSGNHETRIDALETWRSEQKGAAGAVKVIIHIIWAFVAAGGLSFIAWIMTNYNKVTMVVGKISGE